MWTRTLEQAVRGMGLIDTTQAVDARPELPAPTLAPTPDPLPWRTPGEVFCGWYQSSYELLRGVEVWEDVWLDGGDLGPLAEALSFA